MKFLYQEDRFFVQAARGTEEFVGEELRELGALDVESGYRGLHVHAGRETAYRICYASRLASRLLAPLVRFSVTSEKQLYDQALAVPWPDVFSKNRTFAVTFNVAGAVLRNGKYASLLVKDAICDRFRMDTGSRPDVDARNPQVTINLFIHESEVILSADWSGEALHKRGYRSFGGGPAPMQETVAAAIVRFSGFDGTVPLWDPMCGSGTLAAEALMAAARVPAGYLRSGYGLFAFNDFDAGAWRRMKSSCDALIRPVLPGRILASDRDGRAVDFARKNLSKLPFAPVVRLEVSDFREMPDFPDGIIVCNPPYGVRMQPDDGIATLYTALGDFLKQSCTGSTAWVYLGDRTMARHLHLKPARKIPLPSGDLDGRLLRLNLY